jgi:hypothetical protein
MQPGANRHQHRLFRCTSSIAKQRRPKIQTDRREQCPAWMRETQSLKLRRSILKIMQPGANRHQHRLFDALAQSRRERRPIQTDRREQCPAWIMRETRSLGKLRRSIKKYAARCTHQSQIIRCTSSIAKQRRPKIQTDRREQCPRGLCADAVTGKLRRSKLKSCSPVQTDINTDTCCTSSPRSSA